MRELITIEELINAYYDGDTIYIKDGNNVTLDVIFKEEGLYHRLIDCNRLLCDRGLKYFVED